MLETLADLPGGVIGFEAVGKVDANDYETTMNPAIDAAAGAGRIRMVYVIGDRFKGYTLQAIWRDMKLGFDHRRDWDHVALVSDRRWVKGLATLFGWLVPGDFKRFDLGQLSGAVAWAAGVASGRVTRPEVRSGEIQDGQAPVAGGAR